MGLNDTNTVTNPNDTSIGNMSSAQLLIVTGGNIAGGIITYKATKKVGWTILGVLAGGFIGNLIANVVLNKP